MPNPSIVNVAATAELSQPLDLVKLSQVKGFLCDQAIYHCAYLKDYNIKAKVSIFSTGKMISVGCKSLEDAKHDLKHAARKLEELELIKPVKIAVKLQNIVATGELGQFVDIEALVKRLPNAIYEPEQFPGAIYYAKELEGACILICSICLGSNMRRAQATQLPSTGFEPRRRQMLNPVAMSVF